jgi:hypothetical protein
VSPEQLAHRKELSEVFSKLKMKRGVAMGKDLKRKLDLKWAAFHALPSEARKVEASFIQPRVPLQRRSPTATPPSYGFHGKPAVAPVAQTGGASAEGGVKAAAPAGGKPQKDKRGGARLEDVWTPSGEEVRPPPKGKGR